jgi:hypothetical protein
VLGRGGFLVTQPNLNTVRVTNQSGAAANVRLVVRR